MDTPVPSAGPVPSTPTTGRGATVEAGLLRHPDDPDPVCAGKARAVWWLGLLAVLTGPLVGGVVPATVALVLVRQFRQQARPAGGFLTGAAVALRGERLAWAGILLAAAALAAALVVGVYQAAAVTGPDFPATVD